MISYVTSHNANAMYTQKSCIWSNTSGAMRSLSKKGNDRSNILTLSPVMCLPVCLSTYMSMKCVAYAGVTSTIVEEESNELKRSLSRVHTLLSIASVTKGLSGELYSSAARRTCVYAYRVAGSICSPYNPNRNW